MEERAADPLTQPVSAHVWRFGDCEVDEKRRDLRVRGALVEVEAKPWEVLRQLLLHAGEVVTKDELLDSVWPGLTVVDGSLATAISKLRKALGDDSMIVTLPRIGYRLGVSVHTSAVTTPRSAELHLSPGQTVPHREQWRLLRRLEGSLSSEVWLAKHPKTHEHRVFKFASDGERLRSLKREVTLARLLRDSLGERPDFVRVLEWNFDQSPYFVESEYVGPNFAEWAAGEGGLQRIPIDVRLALFTNIVQAVAAAHSLDVLHKDLKPANILISQNAAGLPQIRVADFGSASLLAPSRLGALGITNLGFTQPVDTEQDSITGTVMYIAPEVLAGQSPTTASDVYALGVLLYQLIAGDVRKPLAPGWEADVADELLREDIADAACGDPTRRIQSADELAQHLTSLDERRRAREELARTQERMLVVERRRAQVRTRVPWLIAASLALVAVIGAVLTFNRRSQPPPPLSPVVRTVAVLPFQNIGSDTSMNYLCLALPDEIATTLSHTRGLGVRPFAATSAAYKQEGLDPQKAGREMRVGTVIAGHFMKEGEQLRITLEAIDVETNGVLWRDKIDARVQNMLAMQAQITLRVRGGLVPALGASTTESRSQPKNEQAYDLFLRGAVLPFDPTPNRQGKEMLEKAVQLDPTYAAAWHALARRYYVNARYEGGNPALMDRYEAALERTLELDPDFIPASAGLVVSRAERGDLVRAYHEAKKLVQRRPDNADSQFSLSYVLRYAGLLQESASHCETAFLLDSQTTTYTLRSCAMVFLLRGDYANTSNYLNLDRGSDFEKVLSIEMLVRQGKEQEALQIGSVHNPEWAAFDLLLAYIQHKPATEIDALAQRVRASDDPETNYLSAAHLSYAGYPDAAMRILREAIKGNYCSYPSMESDPMFTNLRAKPEYADIRTAGMQCQNTFVSQR